MPPKRHSDPKRRRRALRAGQGAEWTAELVLRLKGYRILKRRFWVKGGEIDIIASRSGTIVFVEVKHRARLNDALIAIDPTKRRRISWAARIFLLRANAVGYTTRADAMFCAPWRWPQHVEAVFELDLD